MLSNQLFQSLPSTYSCTENKDVYTIERTFSSLKELCLTSFVSSECEHLLESFTGEIKVKMDFSSSDFSFLSISFIQDEEVVFTSSKRLFARYIHFQFLSDSNIYDPNGFNYSVKYNPKDLVEEILSTDFPEKIRGLERKQFPQYVSKYLPLYVKEFSSQLSGVAIVTYHINSYNVKIFADSNLLNNRRFSIHFCQEKQLVPLVKVRHIGSLSKALVELERLIVTKRMDFLFSGKAAN